MLRIQSNTRHHKLTYEPIQPYNGVLMSRNDNVMVPIEHDEDGGSGHYTGDIIQFERHDGSKINYSERRVVQSVEKADGYDRFVLIGFERVNLYFDECSVLEKSVIPEDTPTKMLYLHLTKDHFYLKNRDDDRISGFINCSFIEEDREYGCPGDLIVHDDIFLLKMCATEADGKYIYGSSNILNYQTTVYIEKDGETYRMNAIVPVYSDGTDNTSALLLTGNDALIDEIAYNPYGYAFYGVDERFFLESMSFEEGDDVITTLSLTQGTSVKWRNGDLRINVPAGLTFDANLGQDDAISQFIQAESDGAINKIVDYEKQQFIPVKNEKDVAKIVFKIHLRERTDFEEWKTNDNLLWFNEPEGNLSGDSVSLMGFDEEDIYYQKKKVSETFLRVSIYDSPNRRTQKLLYTAKIYLNVPDLYGKYVSNVANSEIGEPLSNIETEFICTHKYDYYNSTEGFYLHLFPSHLEEGIDGTVYMKCELNNSKYGHTIPLVNFNRGIMRGYIKEKDGGYEVDMPRFYEDAYLPIEIRKNGERYEWEFKSTCIDLTPTDRSLIVQLFEPRINGLSENNETEPCNGNETPEDSTPTPHYVPRESGVGVLDDDGILPEPPDQSIQRPDGWNDPVWEENPETVSMSVRMSPSTLPAEGGTAVINITANTRWYLTVEEGDYITFDKTMGCGNETVTVTYSQNSRTTERNETIKIVPVLADETPTTSMSMVATQQGKSAETGGETDYNYTPSTERLYIYVRLEQVEEEEESGVPEYSEKTATHINITGSLVNDGGTLKLTAKHNGTENDIITTQIWYAGNSSFTPKNIQVGNTDKTTVMTGWRADYDYDTAKFSTGSNYATTDSGELYCIDSVDITYASQYDVNFTGKLTKIETGDEEEPVSVIEYDVQDGNIWIYDTGYCHIENHNDVLLFDDLPEVEYVFRIGSKTYPLNNTGIQMQGGEQHEVHFAEIPATDFTAPGDYKIYVDKQDGSALTKYAKMTVYDSKISISFKIDEVNLDRSSETTFENQLPYGTELSNYINLNIDNNGAILPYDNRKLHFYIERYSNGSSVYRGGAVSIICPGEGQFEWYFNDSTWEKNASDIIYVMYGTKVYDTLTVNIVENDANSVQLRGCETLAYRITVGNTYKIGDLVRFIPEDANFEYFDLSNFSISTSNSSILKVFDGSNPNPTSWLEFYSNYKVIEALSTGRVHLYVNWKGTHQAGGGMDIDITVYNG